MLPTPAQPAHFHPRSGATGDAAALPPLLHQLQPGQLRGCAPCRTRHPRYVGELAQALCPKRLQRVSRSQHTHLNCSRHHAHEAMCCQVRPPTKASAKCSATRHVITLPPTKSCSHVVGPLKHERWAAQLRSLNDDCHAFRMITSETFE